MISIMNIDLEVSKKIFNDAYFSSLMDFSNRFEIYYGGAGSGKSVFIGQKLVMKAAAAQRKVLVIRKVGRTLKDSVFQLILDTLERFQLKAYCKVNLSTFTIELPNGSQFLFKGLDDSEKIKSIVNITDIWIEEASELTQDDFTQLNLRLRASAPNLQMMLSFNPVSKANWVYRYWFENGTPSAAKVLRTTYKDNRFLPQEYIDSLEEMKEKNPTYYKIYALGEFASLDKLVFPSYSLLEEPIDTSNFEMLVGLDFGFVNDPTALIQSFIDDKEKKLYIMKEFYQTGLTNDKIAEAIKYMGLAKSIIVADCAEQKSIEELKRNGIQKVRPSKKGKGSILAGIDKLKEYQIIVNPACENTLIELQNYSWKKDKSTGEYINEPIDSYNHLMDSLRYSLQCRTQRLKTANIKL